MNYAWDLVIRAREQGVPLERLRFTQENPISPYQELALENINESALTGTTVQINGLYRYARIFETLLDDTFASRPELANALFDILMHRLVELDLRAGMTRQEYQQEFLREDLENGRLGAKHARAFAGLTKQQQRQLLVHLMRLYRTGPSQLLLCSAVKELFPHAIVYFKTDNAQELLLYIGQKRTERIAEQVDLLCDAFVPLDYHIELFWEKHFGIVGVAETMLPDEMMLF